MLPGARPHPSAERWQSQNAFFAVASSRASPHRPDRLSALRQPGWTNAGRGKDFVNVRIGDQQRLVLLLNHDGAARLGMSRFQSAEERRSQHHVAQRIQAEDDERQRLFARQRRRLRCDGRSVARTWPAWLAGEPKRTAVDSRCFMPGTTSRWNCRRCGPQTLQSAARC